VEEVFEFQLASLGVAGDVLIAISSSGTSPNIVKAIATAKGMGLATIAMTGFTGGPSAVLADINLHVSAENYGLIEDTHQSIMHILAQFMRQDNLTSPSLIGTLKF
jgi:D-sedoheptulose 7-phosphate isomerase